MDSKKLITDCYKSNSESSSANTSIHREKKRRRTEVLEKKKVVDGLIRSAYSENDHLSYFPSFRHYARDGMTVYLDSGRGNHLSASLKQYIQNLLKINMKKPYGSEWVDEERVKRREMVAPGALYLFVHENLDASANVHNDSDSVVGFLHYRFIVEEEMPVLYVYELQLEPRVQGKGLGKFLMQLIELIAHKQQMGAVLLTVQKANFSALDFYTKLGYVVSTMSPSRVDPLLGTEKNYEILCKALHPEAKAVLEGND